MKKAISLITSMSLLGSAVILSSCSLFGIPINDTNFPDHQIRGAVRTLDKDENGWLSNEEVEAAESLYVWGPCRDLSGIEYLTNLKSLGINGCEFSDLSGVEHLTNLEELIISDVYGQCPDLSAIENLTNLNELKICESVFSETVVFDKEISADKLSISYCVFEKGIIFNNDSVECVTIESSAVIGDVVFADCDGLTGFNAEFTPDDYGLDWCLDDYDYEYFDSLMEQSYNIDLSGCDNLDSVCIDNREAITSVDLSDCNMLSSLTLHDWRDEGDELTLSISGCPNIEYAYIWSECIEELDICDCPYLISASEQTPSDKDWCFEYESEDGYLYLSNVQVVLIK